MKTFAVSLLLILSAAHLYAGKIPTKWWNGSLHNIYPIPMSNSEMSVDLCPWPLPDGKYIAYYRADAYYNKTSEDLVGDPYKIDPKKIIIPDSAVGASFSIVNGKKEGTVLFYSRKGFITGRGQFRNNKEEGEWITHMPGDTTTLVQKTCYKNGFLHGDYYERNPKSGIWLKGKYENDERAGEWTVWAKNGKKLISVDYEKLKKENNVETRTLFQFYNKSKKIFNKSSYAHPVFSNTKDTLPYHSNNRIENILHYATHILILESFDKSQDEQRKELLELRKNHLDAYLRDKNNALIHESFKIVSCIDTVATLTPFDESVNPEKTGFKTKKGELYTLLVYKSLQGFTTRSSGVEELLIVLNQSTEKQYFYDATNHYKQKVILNSRGDTVYQLLHHTIKNLEEVGIGLIIEKNAMKTPIAIDTQFVSNNQFLDLFISKNSKSNKKRKTRNFLANSKFNGKPILCTEYWIGPNFKLLIEWEKREKLKHSYTKYFGEIQRNELHKNIWSGDFHPQFSYFYKSEPYNGKLEFKKGAEEEIFCESNTITIQSSDDSDFCVAEGEVLNGKKTGVWKFNSKHEFSDVECVYELPFQNGKINGSGKILGSSQSFSLITSNYSCSLEGFKPFVMSTLAFKNDYPRGQWYAMSKDENILIEGAFDEKGKQGEFNIYDHFGEKMYSTHFVNNEPRGASLIKIPKSEINIKYHYAISSYTRGICQLNYQNGMLQGYQKIVLDKKILEFFPNTDSTKAKIYYCNPEQRINWVVLMDTLSNKNLSEFQDLKQPSTKAATAEDKLRLLVEDKLNFIIQSVYTQTRNSTNYENWDNPESINFTGSFEVFKEGKKILEGKKRDGKPTGLWTLYDETGAKKIEVDYSKTISSGELDRFGLSMNLFKVNLFFLNGNLMAEGFGFHSIDWSSYSCNNKDVQAITFQKVWNKNGDILLQNGDGKFTVYYPNGITMLDGEYRSGKREGVWYYYSENGHLTKIIPYTNGEKHGLVLKGNLSGVGEQIKQCGPKEYYSALENEILENNVSFMWELYEKGKLIDFKYFTNLKTRIIYPTWNEYWNIPDIDYLQELEDFHAAAEEDFPISEN